MFTSYGRAAATLAALMVGCTPLGTLPPGTDPGSAQPQRELTEEELVDAKLSTPTHPVIAAYRETLSDWLTEEERARLAEVSMDNTMGGDSQRLRYIAADRTIRELLPMALEAQDDPQLAEHAARLRALPPLLNRDVDDAVQPTVTQAMRALRDYREGRAPREPLESGEEPDVEMEITEGGLALPPLERDALETAAVQEVDPEEAAEYADALAEYAEAYSEAFGTSPLQTDAATAAAADAIDAGFLLRRAVEEYGVDRERAVSTALGVVDAMAGAARRRERMPLPAPREPDPADPAAATPTSTP